MVNMTKHKPIPKTFFYKIKQFQTTLFLVIRPFRYVTDLNIFINLILGNIFS